MCNTKTIYFDTFVYNIILENEKLEKGIVELIKSNVIEVIFSDYLLSEMVCACQNTNPYHQLKGRRLFNLVSRIISGKFLKQRSALVREEVNAYLERKSSPSVFINDNESMVFQNTINRLADNHEITNGEPIVAFISDKKHTLGTIKEISKKESFYQAKKVLKGTLFEDFYESRLQTNIEEEFLEELLSKNVGIVEQKDRDIIKRDRVHLTHLTAYLRMCAAYQFALVNEKKVDRGDTVDLKHFSAAATLDILVCDKDFKCILDWTYPEKECLTFQQFLTNYMIA